MEAGFIVWMVVVALVSLAIGAGIGFVVSKPRGYKTDTQGTIYAYYNTPEDKPSLLLEYDVSIASRKRASFDVVVIK